MIAGRNIQQARHERFIDIHDFDAIQALDYNVTLTDVDDGRLRFEIAQALGVHYLGEATADDAVTKAEHIDGYLYGHKRQPALPCVVCFEFQEGLSDCCAHCRV